MIIAFFRLYLDDMSQPFELILKDESTFTFHYGFSKEQWGFHDLCFNVQFITKNQNHINLLRQFIEKIYPYLNGYKNIQKIEFEFLNEKTNNKEHFSFKKGEFYNLNMTQVIHSKQEKTFIISFNINKGE